MHPPPNELYSALSFIGFVLCVIPFYWHLEGNVEAFIWPGYSSKNVTVRCSSEYGHVLVHDLDRSWMPLAIHQLDRVEQEHDQQSTTLL